jgi:outer membrane protein assembly factor BamB
MSKKRLAWLIITCLLFAAIPVVRALMFENDHQIANMLTGLLIFLGSFNLWLWFITLANIGTIVRLLIFVAPIIGFFVFNSLFEIVGFSGEMVPQLKRRGVATQLVADNSQPKKSIDKPIVAGAEPPSTKDSFPQLLGANRDGYIASTQLDPDWTKTPPEIIWKKPIGAGWSGFAIVGNRAVTLEQFDNEERISCYEVSTGNELWKHQYAAKHFNLLGGLGPRSTPTIADGVVYTQGATGELFAIELESGKVKWNKSLLKLLLLDQATSEADVMWGRSGSPLVTKEHVIVPFGGRSANPIASLVALEKETGSMAWQGGDDQISYSSPILATLGGMNQIVCVNEKTVGGYDPASGDLLWSFPWPGLSNQNASVSQPIIVDNDHVLVSKGYGGGAALFKIKKDDREWAATPEWEDKATLKTKFTSAIRKGEEVFGLSDGILECIDGMTGERHWKDRRGRYGHGQMLIVGDHCLILSEEGELILVDATKDQFNERGRIQVLEGKTWNIPSIVGPLVLVRNSDQMACVRLKLAE